MWPKKQGEKALGTFNTLTTKNIALLVRKRLYLGDEIEHLWLPKTPKLQWKTLKHIWCTNFVLKMKQPKTT